MLAVKTLTTAILDGHVTDAFNGVPITGALINLFIPGIASYTANTDSNGYYTFEVPLGAYSFSITAGGYKSYADTVALSESREYIKDVALERSGVTFHPQIALTVNPTIASPGDTVHLTSTFSLAKEDGDLDQDGQISIYDVVKTVKCWKKNVADHPECADADFNNDRIVDIYDVVYIANPLRFNASPYRRLPTGGWEHPPLEYQVLENSNWVTFAEVNVGDSCCCVPASGTTRRNQCTVPYTIPTSTPVPSTLYFRVYYPGFIPTVT